MGPMTSETDFDPLKGFSANLGLTITELGPTRVTADWDIGPEIHQPYGILHGGATAAVVETLASVGAWLAIRDKGGRPVGINNNTDFYRAVSSGQLKVVAEPVFQGRSQQVWGVDVSDGHGRLVSRGQLRLQNLYEQTT